MMVTESYKEKLKKSYFAKKIELESIRDEMTLRKWKILSEANKQGKKIWGYKFTRVKLAEDMAMPFTTVLRILALDRINKKNWSLHKQGKISSYKLAMIASLKNRTYQDEIVKLVIENNIPTHKIKMLKINNISDVNKERHEIAVRKGYARQETAYKAMNNWVSRGLMFMLGGKKGMGEKYYQQLEPSLKKLHKNLGRYIERNGEGEK